MSVLVDTQILIWLDENPNKIPRKSRDIIYTNPNVYFSVASIWEMAIKIKIGKLQMKYPLYDIIDIFKKGYKFKQLEYRAIAHLSNTTITAASQRPVRPFNNCAINHRKHRYC